MMKNLKKLVAAALVCVMALTLLTACGKKASDYQKEVESKLEAAGVTITTTENTAATKAQKLIKAVKSNLSSLVSAASSGSTDTLKEEGKKLLESAGISVDDVKNGETLIYCYGTAMGKNVAIDSVDMKNESSTASDASTYFANELTALQESGKTIKSVGYETYNAPFGVGSVVIMVVEVAAA